MWYSTYNYLLQVYTQTRLLTTMRTMIRPKSYEIFVKSMYGETNQNSYTNLVVALLLNASPAVASCNHECTKPLMCIGLCYSNR